MKQVLIMALVTLFAPSLQLNGMLMTWKLYQAKQDYANRGALLRRIHYAFIPVTGLNYSYFQPILSYTSKIFTKDLEVRRDPGNQASLVNWAHIKSDFRKSTILRRIKSTNCNLR